MAFPDARPHSRRRQSRLSRLFVTWSVDDLFFGVCLVAILFSVIVELRYEAAASSLVSRAVLGEAVIAGASGSAFRQLTYFAIFFAVSGYTLYKAGGLPKMPIPLAYNLACVWCLLSFTWAIVPGISFRRALGMYIILVAVAFCVQSLGARKTLQALYVFLAGLIVFSTLAGLFSRIPVLSFAVHPDDEMDTSLVGAWRGAMMHKNVAGAVMIHASIFFFHHAINRQRVLDWLLFSMAVLFLIMTKSKTSVGWFAFVLGTGLLYRFLMVRRAPAVFTMLVGFGIAGMTTFAYILSDSLYAFFTNPLNLSGRIEIWQSVIPYIEDHPILGSGYGSFWSIGLQSPIYKTARTLFITQIGHSHSGYIEILLTTGVIGLGLALIALLIVPFIRFANPMPGDALLNPMLFSIWMFGMLQNLTESQFFSPDKQSWIFVVIAITIVHTRYLARQSRAFGWLAETAWMPWQGARRIQIRSSCWSTHQSLR